VYYDDIVLLLINVCVYENDDDYDDYDDYVSDDNDNNSSGVD
jgi:hypothetical protein